MRKRILIIALVLLLVMGLCAAQDKKEETQAEAKKVEKDKAEPVVGDFDFKDADLQLVLAHFTLNYKVNFMFDPALQVKVTYKKKQVVWEKALEEIVKKYGLSMMRDENTIRVYEIPEKLE